MTKPNNRSCHFDHMRQKSVNKKFEVTTQIRGLTVYVFFQLESYQLE